jgi:DNA replication protein DnaC
LYQYQISLSQLLASYKNTSTVTEEQILSGLTSCDLLVIDEIGFKKPKLDMNKNYITDDWTNEKIYQIVNNRYFNKKATIFTTNHDMSELRNRLGDRIFTRMMEMTIRQIFHQIKKLKL